jgi:hypothetical protein
MQIEVGKYYRTADGQKVGPMERVIGQQLYWEAKSKLAQGCRTRWGAFGGHSMVALELVAEWIDGPVITETITRKRIVPGAYGKVVVCDDMTVSMHCLQSLVDLSDAIATLTEIRDAMEATQ